MAKLLQKLDFHETSRFCTILIFSVYEERV